MARAERGGDCVGGGEARRGRSHNSTSFGCSDELSPMEDYWSYPGPGLMRSLKESLDAHDAGDVRAARAEDRPVAAVRLLPPRSRGLGPAAGIAGAVGACASAGCRRERASNKPCFDVLIVTPNEPENWDETRRQLQRLRRREDPFTYNVVMVGSFEDAAMATALNESIQAVVIYDGFAFSSRHDAPLLRDHLTRYASLDGRASRRRAGASARSSRR